MRILNIAGYKFIELQSLEELQQTLLAQCTNLGLKGTILLSQEGLNINLAGTEDSIALFKKELPFKDITFRESTSDILPFKRLKVKIKKEIITMGNPAIRPEKNRAPLISPKELKQWLDNKRDIILLDTRNAFEVEAGKFKDAVHLSLKHFTEFPEAAKSLPYEKPIVTYCTGGIRCEKGALQLIKDGFKEVYQLEGGILNYFKEVGGAHYEGECFVFDERITLDTQLSEKGTRL